MKTRIKEEQFSGGEVRFYPQKRVLGFWCHFSFAGPFGSQTRAYKTIEEAKYFLDHLFKAAKKSNIKYHNFP